MILLGIKALHVVAMLTWISGMLMLSILLGAFSREPPCLPQERRLLVVVRRWDQIVTTPAMVLTWLLGFSMALQTGLLAMPWLQVKLALAFGLVASHGVLAGTLRKLTMDLENPLSTGFRLAAGATLGAAALIVMLVVFRPFSVWLGP